MFKNSMGFLTVALSMTCLSSAHADVDYSNNNQNSYFSYPNDNRDLYNRGQNTPSNNEMDFYIRPNSNRQNNPNNDVESNNTYNNGQYTTKSVFNRNDMISDPDLSKTIRDKLKGGMFTKGFENVQVTVYNGDVTLSGSVQTQSDKDKVEREVRDTNGVKSVNSQITVTEPNSRDNDNSQFQDSATSSADEQLNKKIRDKVSRGWLWNSYKNVSLNTSNGVVTLEGDVSNKSDEDKLIGEVQKVDGVRSVRSNLTIRNS